MKWAVHHVVRAWPKQPLRTVCSGAFATSLEREEKTQEIEKVTCPKCQEFWDDEIKMAEEQMKARANVRIVDGPLPI